MFGATIRVMEPAGLGQREAAYLPRTEQTAAQAAKRKAIRTTYAFAGVLGALGVLMGIGGLACTLVYAFRKQPDITGLSVAGAVAFTGLMFVAAAFTVALVLSVTKSVRGSLAFVGATIVIVGGFI